MTIRHKAIAPIAIAGAVSMCGAHAARAQASSAGDAETPAPAASAAQATPGPTSPTEATPTPANPGGATPTSAPTIAAPASPTAAPGVNTATAPLSGQASHVQPTATAAEPTVHANEHEGLGSQGDAPAVATPAVPDWMKWMRGVKIGAGVLLWYYQPIHVPGVENDVSVFWARLLVDGKWGIFGLHLEPRFRDTKLRPFFDGPAWLQEAYASADLGNTQLRVGKTYSRLGLFWYTSFYGNVQVYDGLKLDPDYGATLQGDFGKATDPVSLGWWLQYFVVDGSTNVSLENRDTISYAGARRRNQVIGRVEPRFAFGPAKLAFGASGEYLEATGLPSLDAQNVWRAAADATLTVGDLVVRGEYLHQGGLTVANFPYTGRPSGNNDYVLAGAEYTIGSVTGVYTFSLGSYNDVSYKETMHVPAISVAVSPNISLLGELVFWSSTSPTGSSLIDRSFNVTLHAHL
jgi:hypothetical protein